MTGEKNVSDELSLFVVNDFTGTLLDYFTSLQAMQ